MRFRILRDDFWKAIRVYEYLSTVLSPTRDSRQAKAATFQTLHLRYTVRVSGRAATVLTESFS